MRRWLEPIAVDRHRLQQCLRCEMRGEGIRQAEHGGELGAVKAGAEYPQRHVGVLAGNRVERLVFLRRPEQGLQFDDVLRKAVRRIRAAAQRLQRPLVGTRRPAKAKVDAAGEQRRQRAELLGDHQRRVVRQHDAASADTDRAGACSDMADADGGGGAGDAGEVVMLGEPESGVAGDLGVLREIACIGQRVSRREAFADIGEIEYGKFHHGTTLTHPPHRDSAPR